MYLLNLRNLRCPVSDWVCNQVLRFGLHLEILHRRPPSSNAYFPWNMRSECMIPRKESGTLEIEHG